MLNAPCPPAAMTMSLARPVTAACRPGALLVLSDTMLLSVAYAPRRTTEDSCHSVGLGLASSSTPAVMATVSFANPYGYLATHVSFNSCLVLDSIFAFDRSLFPRFRARMFPQALQN